MTYAGHLKIVASGILGTVATPVEIFSFGISMSNTIGPSWPAGYADDVRDATNDFFVRANTQISSAAFLNQVKLSQIDTDGSLLAPADVRSVANHSGGAGVSHWPFQCARCVSLGASSDSRHAKGRFYLPLPSENVNQDTGKASTGGEHNIAVSVQTWFSDLATILGETVVVASKTDGNHTVHTVRVGDVIDTIRRRRNALVEAYSAVSIP